MNAIGSKIKESRKKKRLTQRQLAELLGVRHGAISSWESNTTNPYRDKLVKLMEILEIDANYLFSMNDFEYSQDLEKKIVSNEKIKNIIPILENLNEAQMDEIKKYIDYISLKKD